MTEFEDMLSSEPGLTFVIELLYPNNSVYKGQMKLVDSEQIRHGYGLQVWPDGAKYKGNWADNKAQG